MLVNLSVSVLAVQAESPTDVLGHLLDLFKDLPSRNAPPRRRDIVTDWTSSWTSGVSDAVDDIFDWGYVTVRGGPDSGSGLWVIEHHYESRDGSCSGNMIEERKQPVSSQTMEKCKERCYPGGNLEAWDVKTLCEDGKILGLEKLHFYILVVGVPSVFCFCLFTCLCICCVMNHEQKAEDARRANEIPVRPDFNDKYDSGMFESDARMFESGRMSGRYQRRPPSGGGEVEYRPQGMLHAPGRPPVLRGQSSGGYSNGRPSPRPDGRPSPRHDNRRPSPRHDNRRPSPQPARVSTNWVDRRAEPRENHLAVSKRSGESDGSDNMQITIPNSLGSADVLTPEPGRAEVTAV